MKIVDGKMQGMFVLDAESKELDLVYIAGSVRSGGAFQSWTATSGSQRAIAGGTGQGWRQMTRLRFCLDAVLLLVGATLYCFAADRDFDGLVATSRIAMMSMPRPFL